MNIGTAELRNRLSYFLEKVRRGARIVVTDRGRPVAQLVPLEEEGDLATKVAQMAADSSVTLPSGRPRAPVTPVQLRRPEPSASATVGQLRDER